MNQITENNIIIINNKKIPPCPYKVKGSQRTTIIDDKVYVNGYEYKEGVWKRTFWAVFHYIFD